MVTYIETDYHGGTGSQSAVLYENGKQTICTVTDNMKPDSMPENLNEYAINSVLIKIGVRKSVDEFESINLDDYRLMPDEDDEDEET